METSPIPLVAEVSALYEIVELGVSGIQLSEETAVGKFPLEAVRWIRGVERLVNDESDIRRARAASNGRAPLSPRKRRADRVVDVGEVAELKPPNLGLPGGAQLHVA